MALRRKVDGALTGGPAGAGPPGVRGPAVSAFLWAFVGGNLRFPITFATGIVLARLLVPEDFGTVALAGAIVVLVMRLSSFGFDIILFRERDITRPQMSTLFWAKEVAIGTGMLLCFLIALLTRSFYSTTTFWILIVVAIFSALRVTTHLPSSLLIRDLKFKQIQMVDLSVTVLSSAVGIALAANGWGPWTLILSGAGGVLVNGLIRWRLAGWWPALTFDWPYLRSRLSFSGGMLLAGFLEETVHRLDTLVLGNLKGVHALGLYGMAYGQSEFFHNRVVVAFQTVGMPVIGRIHQDLSRLREFVTLAISGVLYLGGLFYALVAPLAVDLIVFIYGEKWHASGLLLQGLALYGVLLPLFETTRIVLLGRGKSILMAKIYGLEATVLLVGLIALVPTWGAAGAVLAVDVMIACACIVTLYLVNREIEGLRASWLSILGKPALAALACAAVVLWARSQLLESGPVAVIALAPAAGLGVWLLTAIVVDRSRLMGYVHLLLGVIRSRSEKVV